MRALNAAEMASYERWAMEIVGLPEVVLMENAARGALDVLFQRHPEVQRFCVLAGPGHNGADGLALARLLAARGCEVEVGLLGEPEKRRPLTARQLAACEALGVSCRPLGQVDLGAFSHDPCAVVIDAVFGTGLTRPLEGQAAALAETLSAARCTVVALDLPSGLDASRSELQGPTIQAAFTVTFAAPKVAHVLAPADALCGSVEVVDLGLPFDAAVLVGEGVLHAAPSLSTFERAEARALLRARSVRAHKASVGRVLVVAGSPGMSGAAILAARAAVRAGGGLVTLAVPAPLASVADAGSLESLTLGVAAGSTGELAPEAAERLLGAAAARDACAVGPGLGRSEACRATVLRLVAECTAPLVLDADGLFALGQDLGLVAGRRAPTLLTPHAGELGRLLGVPSKEVDADRVGAVRQAARSAGCAVLLKGHQTLVAGPDGAVHVNTTGNPGLASGGTGDVLTGLAGSLLAQGLGATEAGIFAAWVHGAAADAVVQQTGQRGLRASDLPDAMGGVWAALEEGRSC